MKAAPTWSPRAIAATRSCALGRGVAAELEDELAEYVAVSRHRHLDRAPNPQRLPDPLHPGRLHLTIAPDAGPGRVGRAHLEGAGLKRQEALQFLADRLDHERELLPRGEQRRSSADAREEASSVRARERCRTIRIAISPPTIATSARTSVVSRSGVRLIAGCS